MPKQHDHYVKIEAGQILNPENFPVPNELVCIHVPKVFDQVSVRDCITKNINLMPTPGNYCPSFSFLGVTDFNIIDIKVISKTDSITKPGFKKLKLAVKVGFTVHYSDGIEEDLEQSEDITFNLTVYEIYCPNCLTQIGVVRYPELNDSFMDKDGTLIKVEAILEAFNDVINGKTLMLSIGGFFIVKCECEVQLLIPAYGYCPVPPEEHKPSPTTLTCTMFNDKNKTPFPTQFFPDQKFNPLDTGKREGSDD